MSRSAPGDAGIREAITSLEERIDAIATAVMGTEEFAKTANLAANLQMRMQKGMAGHMSRQLALFNMPSREDINALAERVMTMDERLVRVEALLVGIARASGAGTPAQTANKPSRTRRPPLRAAAAPDAGRSDARPSTGNGAESAASPETISAIGGSDKAASADATKTAQKQAASRRAGDAKLPTKKVATKKAASKKAATKKAAAGKIARKSTRRTGAGLASGA